MQRTARGLLRYLSVALPAVGLGPALASCGCDIENRILTDTDSSGDRDSDSEGGGTVDGDIDGDGEREGGGESKV